jgi:hypothetical protein
MPVNYSVGTIHSAPRVIETKDTRGGCPGTAPDGTLLISQTFTVDNSCIYFTHGRIIFNAGSAGKTRADFNLRINGSIVKNALDTSLTSAGGLGSWEELDATFSGTLSAGTHNIQMYGSNGSNCWGCGGDWGQITTVVWEVS